jgi:hypothetical protein
MKHYIYIITALLPIFLLAACVQEEITGNNQNSDMITLNVSVSGTSAATRAVVTPEGKESNISNLYILFYKAGRGDEAKPDYFCSATGVEGSVWTKSFLLSSTKLEKGESYNAYTLANLPSTVVSPTGQTTKGDLLAMKESIAIGQVRKLDGSDISFSSYKDTTFSISATEANEYKVNLTRTVARLDMSIDTTKISADWMIESVNLINEQLSTNYYQKNTAATTNDATRIGQANRLLNQDGKSQWRYYLYETPKNVEPKVSLKINLKSKTSASTRSYTAIVNKKGGGEIVRNYIYQSTILLTDKVDPVIIETTPLAWNDTIGVNVSIPSVYLDFPTSNILLSDRGAVVYNFKSDADSVYIETDMPNLVIQSILGKNKGYILPKVDSKDVYELNMIMSSYTTLPETGKITFKAGNLTKEMTVEKPSSDASFSYTVSPCDSWTPDNIRIYDWQTESDAQFTIELKGITGQEAWFGFTVISQLNHATGNIFYIPDGVYTRERMLVPHTFAADTTFVFDVKDMMSKSLQPKGYTFTYKMLCGPSNYLFAPILKEFIFAVKRDKDN